MQEYYVLLTGSRGNSGDDLIKSSAIKLFKEFRQDRDFFCLNAWEKLDSEKLDLVNKAKALILLGGPALRFDTFPSVYPLTDSLNDITAPIIMLGVGYRDQNGSWNNTSKFYLSEKTKLLLSKIDNSGYISAVRDFHTLNVLISKGYKNFVMAGCPAMYNTEYFEKPFSGREIHKIAFAPGRMYRWSRSMFSQQIKVILGFKKANPDKKFTVAFHDPIDLTNIQTTAFIKELEQHEIDFTDISGSAQNLVRFYSEQDLQIGYRVHAHIFMCSINRPSVLMNEDGRGKGMRTVLDGLIFDAYRLKDIDPISKLKLKMGLLNINNLVIAEDNLVEDIVTNFRYESENYYPRMSKTRTNIDYYFSTFKDIIQQLP